MISLGSLYPEVFKAALHYLHPDHQAAEEAAQDALVALHNLPEEKQTAPLGFAKYHARFKALHTLSKKRTMQKHTESLDKLKDAIPDFDEFYGLVDTRRNPREALEHKELLEEIERAVETLPPARQRTLRVFAETEGDYDETARLLGVSVGTVKAHLNHARRDVRATMRLAA